MDETSKISAQDLLCYFREVKPSEYEKFVKHQFPVETIFAYAVCIQDEGSHKIFRQYKVFSHKTHVKGCEMRWLHADYTCDVPPKSSGIISTSKLYQTANMAAPDLFNINNGIITNTPAFYEKIAKNGFIYQPPEGQENYGRTYGNLCCYGMVSWQNGYKHVTGHSQTTRHVWELYDEEFHFALTIRQEKEKLKIVVNFPEGAVGQIHFKCFSTWKLYVFCPEKFVKTEKLVHPMVLHQAATLARALKCIQLSSFLKALLLPLCKPATQIFFEMLGLSKKRLRTLMDSSSNFRQKQEEREYYNRCCDYLEDMASKQIMEKLANTIQTFFSELQERKK